MATTLIDSTSTVAPPQPMPVVNGSQLTVQGRGLTIEDIAKVASGRPIHLSDDPRLREGIANSSEFIGEAVRQNASIYGVTTCFGGLADRVLPSETAADLQMNLVWSHKAGSGARLPAEDVRAGMLLRMNALAGGISGVRLELIERYETLLNEDVIPHVREFGSIGACGDQVPLAYVAGAAIGLAPAYRVDFRGEEMSGPEALSRLGLAPIPLLPKEGLALINGTSMTTGIAANCVYRARRMLALSMGTHALFIQALGGSLQSFHPFIHQHKAHPGQVWSAREMLGLLKDSRLVPDDFDGQRQHRAGHLIQDRYSVRCLPQFMGPIVDGLAQIARQVEVEANSVTDNPLIDAPRGAVYHCGNFLAQYVGLAMDQLRHYLGLLAKHLDVQIALLVTPEFNNGLPPSLIGNGERGINTGLKALQLTANSIMPMLLFYGNSLADRFPTHAEQFNQNLNSQGMGASCLTRKSLDLFEQYAALSLMFAIQAADLRTYVAEGHYDSRRCLSPATLALYEAIRKATGIACSASKPYLRDDQDIFLDAQVDRILADIRRNGPIMQSLGELTTRVIEHAHVTFFSNVS
jgi:phenylalanine ammonia-lyase